MMTYMVYGMTYTWVRSVVKRFVFLVYFSTFFFILENHPKTGRESHEIK